MSRYVFFGQTRSKQRSISRRGDIDFAFGIRGDARFVRAQLAGFRVEPHRALGVFLYAFAPVEQPGQFEACVGIAAFAHTREQLGRRGWIAVDAASFDVRATCAHASAVCSGITGARVENSFGGGIIREYGIVIEVAQFHAGPGAVIEARGSKDLDTSRRIRFDSFAFVINEAQRRAVFVDVLVTPFGAAFEIVFAARQSKGQGWRIRWSSNGLRRCRIRLRGRVLRSRLTCRAATGHGDEAREDQGSRNLEGSSHRTRMPQAWPKPGKFMGICGVGVWRRRRLVSNLCAARLLARGGTV